MSKITVIDGKKEYQIIGENNRSVLSLLIENDNSFSAYCGGQGLCGKCKIQVLEGELVVTEADQRFFSETELESGYRLACMAYPESDCRIRVCMEKEQEMEVVVAGADVVQEAEMVHGSKSGTVGTACLQYGIAVDIGTTTIAMQLIRKDTKEVVGIYTALNPQRSYGADVITRIHAANAGKGKVLQEKMVQILNEGLMKLLNSSTDRAIPVNKTIPAESIEEIIISANTTMIHLLLGYPCETLGVSPFEPYEIAPKAVRSRELFSREGLDCEVKFMPGISTFVGGDIVAGLYSCDILQEEEPVLFIDLGTNGEMAIGNKDKLIVTSVAAGPAFEGGNISCGIGSIPGAVSSVKMHNRKLSHIEIIGGKEAIGLCGTGVKTPIGLCGTGVIETVYELKKENLLDETGLFVDDIFETGLTFESVGGSFTFVQKDVREIQLAKSAVRSGIEVLLKRSGFSYNDIKKVYLAGGFGYRVNTEKMIGIGMMPEEFKNKIVPLGNASLTGAGRALFAPEAFEALDKIASHGEEINLAMDADFQQLYMEYIYF